MRIPFAVPLVCVMFAILQPRTNAVAFPFILADLVKTPGHYSDQSLTPYVSHSIVQSPLQNPVSKPCRAVLAAASHPSSSGFECPRMGGHVLPGALGMDEVTQTLTGTGSLQGCAKSCLEIEPTECTEERGCAQKCEAIGYDWHTGLCTHFRVPAEELRLSPEDKPSGGFVSFQAVTGDVTYSEPTFWSKACWELECSGRYIGLELEKRKREYAKELREYWTKERMLAAVGA